MYYKQVNAGVDPVNATMQFLRLRSFEEEKISIIAKITKYPECFLVDRWVNMVSDAHGDEDELNEKWDDFVTITFERDWTTGYEYWCKSKEEAK